MVTVYTPPAAPTVAWLQDIQVRATLETGQVTTLGYYDLCYVLVTRPTLIRAVEPIRPSLAFVLYLHDRLWAWSFAALAVAWAGDVRGPLLHMGPPQVQAKRWRAFDALAAHEQAQVLRDTVTADLFLEPKRLRIPLQGILHAGWHHFDTGTLADASRLFTCFDQALGVDRKATTATTPVSALTPAGQAQYLQAAVPAQTDDLEDAIQDLTATLSPKERAATQHWLRAKVQGRDFRDYCARLDLPYEASRKAAQRGLARRGIPHA
jgi:hypothetical protein